MGDKKNVGTVESQDIQFPPSSEARLSVQISLNVCLIYSLKISGDGDAQKEYRNPFHYLSLFR